MEYESEPTRQLGCWDAPNLLAPTIDAFTSNEPTPDFEPPLAYCDMLVNTGFGEDCPTETREYWRKTIRENYHGDDGRRRIRMSAINLRDRDGLHARLFDVRCPVLWLHVSPCQIYICVRYMMLIYICRPGNERHSLFACQCAKGNWTICEFP